MLGCRIGLAAALAAVAVFSAPVMAQSPIYRFAHSDDPLQDRDAYLLTVLQADPAARKAIAADPALAPLSRRLSQTYGAVLAICRQGKACPVEQMMLSDAEVAAVGDELARLAASPGPLHAVVEHQLRRSGQFQKDAGLDDSALMRAAWVETAGGVNRLYRVYALAQAPRYPLIDAMAYDPAAAAFRNMLVQIMEADADAPPPGLFFSAWSKLGFDLLRLNQRDEAARYEPLETGANAAAFAHARELKWAAKPYTAIVVPGEGLEEGQTGLSPLGAVRVELAARRWRQGLAPFIIVSGGHVHPNRTPFAEADEMKRELMARWSVPADAIVIDPYARHTTTNVRNATRLLFRMGAPMDRPMLITTTADQSRYMEAPMFEQRSRQELGYALMSDVKRVSLFDLAAKPNLTSLQFNPEDPLDP